MTLARKLAGFLLLVVLFGYPAMACLTSAAEMTEVERECCKQMAEQCGSMDMPASHSCCQKEVRSPQTMLRVAPVHFVPFVATTGVVNDVAPSPGLASEFSFFQIHPPPESPPGTSSILRI